MLMDKDILNQIYPYIGSDSLKKLLLILKKTNPKFNNRDIKSGDALSLTLSYCIEIAYNELFNSFDDNSPSPLPPPKTSKSQLLYGIFQLVTSLRAKNLSNKKIINYLNKKQIPTPDHVMNKYSLALIQQHTPRWGLADLTSILTEQNKAEVLLYEYLEELNHRAQK